VLAHSPGRVGLRHRIDAGAFERALGELRLFAAAERFHDDQFRFPHTGIVCPERLPANFTFDRPRLYNPLMSDRNPLAGIVPRVVHRADRDETTIAQQIDQIEGEVALDRYVKAQQVMRPEIVKRITELENSLQRLANAVFASHAADEHPELRPLVEEAKLVLKNRLEVDNTDHSQQPIHTELGAFPDDLRLIKE